MRPRIIQCVLLTLFGVSLSAACGPRRGPEPATPAPTQAAASRVSPTGAAPPTSGTPVIPPSASDPAGAELERLLDDLAGALDQADTLEDARDLIP